MYYRRKKANRYVIIERKFFVSLGTNTKYEYRNFM